MSRRVLTAVLLTALMAPAPALAQTRGRQWFTYDEAFGASGRFGSQAGLQALPQITGWLDGDHWLETREGKVWKVRAIDGAATLHQDPAALAEVAPKGLTNNAIAARSADDALRIHVVNGDLWAVDVPGRTSRRLTQTPGAEENPTLSPDGAHVAYTRGGNLFTYDLAARIERQLTSDGSDTIRNGYASWVYFEEILGRGTNYRAFWWSPDSSRLAFLRFDDSPVPVFPIYWADGQHGRLEQQRYPKAGDPNPFVQVGRRPRNRGPRHVDAVPAAGRSLPRLAVLDTRQPEGLHPVDEPRAGHHSGAAWRPAERRRHSPVRGDAAVVGHLVRGPDGARQRRPAGAQRRGRLGPPLPAWGRRNAKATTDQWTVAGPQPPARGRGGRLRVRARAAGPVGPDLEHGGAAREARWLRLRDPHQDPGDSPGAHGRRTAGTSSRRDRA